MLTLSVAVVLLVALLPVLFTRITRRPFFVDVNLTEGGANTYTEQDFEAPLTALAGGKIQGLELVRSDLEISAPDSEDGQLNQTHVQLVRDSQSALINYDDEDLVARWALSNDSSAINGSSINQSPITKDHTMPDNNGKLFGPTMIERQFHVGIVGSGNATAKAVHGRLHFHVISMSSAEVIQDLILDADD